eukprot:711715-Ditylum_brightwellii.AAC.1
MSPKAAKEELQKVRKNLYQEQHFVHNVSAKSLNNIIKLNVRGILMAAKCSTLRIIKDSQLERQFDDAIWLGEHTSMASVEKWSHEEVAD